MSFGFDRAALTSEEAERKWFATLLWQAFPMCRSENELCERAAKVLSSKNRSVTSRAVRNWIRCENTPHFRFVLTVYALAQAERIAKAISP